MQTDNEVRSREEQAGEKKDPGILSLSVFGGAIAAVCCLGVPLLVLLGSTGAVIGSLDAFASLRPYLIAGAWVLAVLVVLYAIYRQVRRPATGCEAGDACEPKQSESDSKSVRWV